MTKRDSKGLPDLKAFTVIVSGDVQGVGFRRAAQRLARNFGIVGHVKNMRDGTVEIFAQGEAAKLESFFNSIDALESPVAVQRLEKSAASVSRKRKYFDILHGSPEEELDEGLGAGEAQLSLLRKNTNENFNTLATRYDKISETLTKVVEESSQSREDFKKALDTLTTQTKEFKMLSWL